VTQAADRALVIELAWPEPSPGIRTYQASLLGLLLTAISLGQARGQYPHQQARALADEISALTGPVAATAGAVKDQCREVAGIAAASPVLVMTGSGPGYGTALLAAAKMTETAGVFAAGQDLEEWCHVESLAYPDAMPVFVITPPGRSRRRASALAAMPPSPRRGRISACAPGWSAPHAGVASRQNGVTLAKRSTGVPDVVTPSKQHGLDGSSSR